MVMIQKTSNHQNDILYLLCRRYLGEFIMMLHVQKALAPPSLISISASPHFHNLPMSSAYLDIPTQLPDRAIRPQISPED